MPELAGAVWPRVPEAALLVVPLGSVEQHGHHLPMATDTAVASAVARAALPDLAGALLAPALPYGASGEHEGFPGTVSIGTEALTSGAGRARAVGRPVGGARARGQRPRRQPGGTADGGAAAALGGWGRGLGFRLVCPVATRTRGRTETSLMLHVEPGRVRAADAVAGETAPVGATSSGLLAEGVRAVSPTGVLGDPAGASAGEGAELLAAIARRLVVGVAEWRVDPAGRLG